MDNKISLDISRINEKINEIERRLNSIDRVTELIYKDRDILSEIQGSIAQLKSIMISNQQHQDNSVKDIKSDIDDVQSINEAKVDEVIQVMDDKTMLVKSNNHNIFENIKNLFKKNGGGEKK